MVQDAVMKLYRCVFETKMKAEFADVCLTNRAEYSCYNVVMTKNSCYVHVLILYKYVISDKCGYQIFVTKICSGGRIYLTFTRNLFQKSVH